MVGTGNGDTGKVDLGRLRDEENAKLREENTRLRDELEIRAGERRDRFKLFLSLVSVVVVICTGVCAGLGWYTGSMIDSAMAKERVDQREKVEVVVQQRIRDAKFASLEVQASTVQRLEDINVRLSRLEQKVDLLLTRRR